MKIIKIARERNTKKRRKEETPELKEKPEGRRQRQDVKKKIQKQNTRNKTTRKCKKTPELKKKDRKKEAEQDLIKKTYKTKTKEPQRLERRRTC